MSESRRRPISFAAALLQYAVVSAVVAYILSRDLTMAPGRSAIVFAGACLLVSPLCEVIEGRLRIAHGIPLILSHLAVCCTALWIPAPGGARTWLLAFAMLVLAPVLWSSWSEPAPRPQAAEG